MRNFEIGNRSRRILRMGGILRGRPFLGPRVVTLEITHLCNLRCSFCESHGSRQLTPITRRRTYVGERRSMDPQAVGELAIELADLGTDLLELSGKGDPISHPHLSQIVRLVKGSGLACSLFTNGTLARPGLAETLVDCRLDRVVVSMNAGSRAVYERVAGRDLWGQAVAFVDDVLAARADRKSRVPWIRLSHVVQKENEADLESMVRFAVERGVDEIGFCVMSEVPGTRDLQLDPRQAQRIRREIPRWRSMLFAAGVAHTLELFDTDLGQRIAAESRRQKNPLQRHLPCYDGWMFASIAPDGTISPCCYCEDVVAGILDDGGFREVWFGPRYQSIRARMRAMPYTGVPICAECFTTCNRALENQRIHRRVYPLARSRNVEMPVRVD